MRNPHRNVPIDFNNVIKLPESHTWCKESTNHESISISPTNSTIPIIDMNDPKAMHQMKKACEEWGMFWIINHGIEIELLKKMEDQTRKLFALPAEQKLQALRPSDSNSGYGIPKMSPFYPKLMWSEGFSIQGSPSELAPLLWPQECTASINFCKVMNEYRETLKGVSQKILSMMLTSLGLTDDDVKWFKANTGSNCTQTLLQLNSYPICPEPDKAMGLAPHTDSSLITLLYQSNTSGLQLFQDNIGWITVEPITGAIVVNAGDLLQIFSNGIFKSALHRAMVNQAQHRISVAFFLGPPKDAVLTPPMKLVENGQLPLYRPITWKDYLDVKAAHFNKALDHIRLDPPKSEI